MDCYRALGGGETGLQCSKAFVQGAEKRVKIEKEVREAALDDAIVATENLSRNHQRPVSTGAGAPLALIMAPILCLMRREIVQSVHAGQDRVGRLSNRINLPNHSSISMGFGKTGHLRCIKEKFYD